MANVDIKLGYKDAAWFTSNATLVLKVGQIVFLEQTGTYKIGDGVTQLQNLLFLGAGDTKKLEATGILTGGILSIGTGGAGVATTFNLTAGTGQIVDNTVNPFTLTNVSWSAKTNVALPNIGSQPITYVAIDSSGNVQLSATDWTPTQMRSYIEIGLIVHSDYATVNAVNQMNVVAYNPINQFSDLTYSLGLFNISGNVFSANGSNLSLNKSAGSLFRQGANYTDLTNNPHIVTNAPLTVASLRMVNRTGSASSTTVVDVDNYDLAGVTTTIPANKYAIHRIYLFTSNLVAIQRGQAYYNSLAEAKASIQLENYVTNPGLANGLLRGYLCVKKGATALNNTNDAFFFEASKFGGTVGAGGVSVSTLQNAYNNSSDPEITTDATRGAVSIKRGSAADTDNILEGVNGSGVITAYLKGNGENSFNNIPRVLSITSSATPTIDASLYDVVNITAQAVDITSFTTNLSGTGSIGNFKNLIINIKDNGTIRNITWGTSFNSLHATLPTATIVGKTLSIGLKWNSSTSKFDCYVYNYSL